MAAMLLELRYFPFEVPATVVSSYFAERKKKHTKIEMCS